MTNTGVALLYIEKKANSKIVSNIKEKLSTIKIESLTNIGQMQSFLADKKTLIPLINSLEKNFYPLCHPLLMISHHSKLLLFCCC